MMASKNLEISEISELHALFTSFDTDNDGRVSRLEFNQGMRDLCQRRKSVLNNRPGTALIFDSIDSDNSGSIEFGEFLAAAAEKKIHTASEVSGCFYDFIGQAGSVAALLRGMTDDYDLTEWIDREIVDRVVAGLDRLLSESEEPRIEKRKFIALFLAPSIRRKSSCNSEKTFSSENFPGLLTLPIRTRN